MSDRPRAVIACPGRGSYGAGSLGSLPPDHPAVERAESLRAGVRPGAAARAGRRDHLRPVAPPAPGERVGADLHGHPARCRARGGRPRRGGGDRQLAGLVLGAWRSPARCSFDDAFRLVQEIALLQEEPLPDPAAPAARSSTPSPTPTGSRSPTCGRPWPASVDGHGDGNGSGRIYESIDLGAYAVLAGDDAGVAAPDRPPAAGEDRRAALPAATGDARPVSHAAGRARGRGAAERLAGLALATPRRCPSSTAAARAGRPGRPIRGALRDYTLGEQLTTPFRFATSLRVALREYAPGRGRAAGPRQLAGGHLRPADRGRGLPWPPQPRRLRARRSSSGTPVVLSMRRQ